MKKVLSLFLVLVMLLGMMPMAALASESIETTENPWDGRSAVFVGDSITAGVGTTKKYYQFLEEFLGFGSVTAMGVGGSCISAYSDYGQKNQPLINRYQNIPSADLILIFMGTNDYGHETPLGTVENAKDGTFYGALNTIIPALVAKHTSSKIVFVTPLHRYGFGTSKLLGTKFTYDNIPNGVGATLGDYVNAVKTVCANNGVSVIDLYTQCTLDPSDAAVRATYMPDGIHPNAAGHEVVAGIMESYLRTLEPVESEPVAQPEMIQGNKFAAGNNQPCRASSRINYYLKAGTEITLKNPELMQWACARTSNAYSSENLGYFQEKQWTDIATAVVQTDGWIGFTFKYRDETQAFDLTRPLSDYITIEEPHAHSYTTTVTAPSCTEQGCTTYTCSCGDSYVDDYVDALGHSYENGICTVCGEYYVKFQSATISLAGNIAINFYVELGQPILDDAGAYMSFTLPDGTAKTAMLSDAEVSVKNGVTRYVFTCEVHAKQMADMVVAQMHLGDGTAVGDSKSYSVVTYAGYIIAHKDQYAAYPSLVNLLKTMLNYGAYSQIHFGYNVNSPANAGLNLTLNDVTLGEVGAYRVKRAGGVTGLNIASVTLILRSETVLRFYYNLSEGYNIQDYTFVVKGQTVRPQYNESNGRYYVEVANIAAKDLDREYGVTVTNKAGTESLSVIASAMSYVYQVISNPAFFTEDVKDVVKAMYAYNTAANAYFK